jgi:hypothetical protein
VSKRSSQEIRNLGGGSEEFNDYIEEITDTTVLSWEHMRKEIPKRK